jgi:S-adenosylmethionine:tRNA ribosyltransferase-isomerase
VATVAADLGEGRCRLCFSGPGDVGRLVRTVAELPLPPYIHRHGGPDAADLDRYQTVYAREPGSVAAPTAGLHFTPDLIRELTAHGVRVAFLTLHVGPATFQPLRSEDLGRHHLEGEAYTIPGETVDAIDQARAVGGRVVAVGTTTTRALESAGDAGPTLRAGDGVATLFIRPGHRFRVVDGLITNFHLPRSSLLVLVAAFLGRRRLLAAYAEALARGYRFYSYGDAMAAFAPGGPAGRQPSWSP